MSRKISEFFTLNQKIGGIDDKLRKEVKVKHEEEGNFDISLVKIEKEVKVEENSSMYPEYRVMLKDLKQEVQENFEAQEKGWKSKSKLGKVQNIDEKDGDKCNFCEKSLSSKGNLTRHMKSFHTSELKIFLNCEICDAVFVKKHNFEQHIKTKHIDAKPFECDYDGKIFDIKNKLLKHMKCHQMTVRCEICDLKVKPTSLEEHIKSVHSTERKFQCKICSKSFKTSKLLKTHEITHNKKFKCEMCNKNFSLLSRLKKHKKEYHENPKGFECEICGKKFSLKINLKEHGKIHEKNRQKQFKCQRCDFAADRKINFEKHQNFHERQDKKFSAMKNPIKCEKCPTFCRNKKALLRHMIFVHPKNFFQCDLCGNYFKTMMSLKRHLRLHQ